MENGKELLLFLFLLITFRNALGYVTDLNEYFSDGCIPESATFVCITVERWNNMRYYKMDTNETIIPEYVTTTMKWSENYDDECLGSTDNCDYYQTMYRKGPGMSYTNSNFNGIKSRDASRCFLRTNEPRVLRICANHDHIGSEGLTELGCFNIDESNLNYKDINTGWRTEYPRSDDDQHKFVNGNNINMTYEDGKRVELQFRYWLSNDQCIYFTTGQSGIFDYGHYIYLEMGYSPNVSNEWYWGDRIHMTANIREQINDINVNFYQIYCMHKPPYTAKPFLYAKFYYYDKSTAPVMKYDNFNAEYFSPGHFEVIHDGNRAMEALYGSSKVNVEYWRTCKNINECRGECFTQKGNTTTKTYKSYTILSVSLLFLLFILLFIVGVYANKNKYIYSDRIKYTRLVWFILLLWNTVSIVVFVFYIHRLSSVILNQVLFWVSVSFVGISYLYNLILIIDYLQIWLHSLAPGITRHWLEQYSWVLIALTLITTNVQIGIELCNSSLLPIGPFSMHLSHNEIIRTRKLQIFSTVFLIVIPFLLIYIIYIIFNEFDGVIPTNDPKYDNYIIYNGILSSTVLLLFLSFNLLKFKHNKRLKNSLLKPIGIYHFEFELKTLQFKPYFIHSIKNIKIAIMKTFYINNPDLIIIDACVDNFRSMQIEGRLLKDNSSHHNRNKLNNFINEYINDPTKQSELLQNLIQNFKLRFGLTIKGVVSLQNFHLSVINDGEGQQIYEYITCVSKVINSIKLCCKSCIKAFICKKKTDAETSE